MIYNDIQTALELWDTIDEASEVYIPIVLGDGNEKNFVFLETLKKGKEERRRLLVFLNRSEADTYKLSTKKSKMSIAKTTMLGLIHFLEKHCKGSGVDRKIDCVLSTIDVEGKCHWINMVWSNYEQTN